MAEKRPRQQRRTPYKVRLNDEEKAVIDAAAGLTRLPPATYIRQVALGYQPASKVDSQAVVELARLRADVGRVGGLLKLWLAEKRGQGGVTPRDVSGLYDELQVLKDAMAAVMRSLPAK